MSLSSLRVEEVGEGDLRKSGSFKNSLSRATTGVYLLFTSFILVLVCNANFFLLTVLCSCFIEKNLFPLVSCITLLVRYLSIV